MNTETTPSTNRKISPALVLFLLFPLLGLAAALMTALSGGTTGSDNLAPLTQAPMGMVRMNWSAPNMTLTALDGTYVEITDFRGRITILNFWATWCPPCVRELPTLSTFAQEQDPETGVRVVGINTGETPETINAYFEQYHVTDIEVLLDPAGAARSLYGVINMPQTFFLDEEGIVRFFKVGEITRDDIDSYIAELESES